jgi:thioesterase domain-containing protein
MAGRTLINRLIHHGEDGDGVLASLRSLSDEEQLEAGLKIIRDRALLPSDYGASQIHELFHAHVACVMAHHHYVARPVEATVDVFVPECDLEADFMDWSDTLRSTRRHVTSGDHSTQLSEPHVRSVAEVLRHTLNQHSDPQPEKTGVNATS